MSHLKITFKLALGFGLVLLIVVLTSGTGYLMATRTAAESANNSAGSDILSNVDDAVEAVLTAINAVRTHMLVPSADDAGNYGNDVKTVADALGNAKAAAASYSRGAEVASRLDRLATVFAAWRATVGDKIIPTDMTGSSAVETTTALIRSDAAKAARTAIFDAVADLKKQLHGWSDADQLAEDAAVANMKLLQLLGLATAVVASSLIAWVLSRAIARPMVQMTGVMAALAAGDVELTVPARGRRDEVGQMAEAVQVFKDAAIQKSRLEGEAAEARQAAEAERARNESDRAEAAERQSAVVKGIASGLEHLAGGNLMFRLPTPFATEYEKLRTDFNGAMNKLRQALTVVASNTAAIRSGSTEISTAADDLSRRTEQQAASLEETAAALDQITATVKKTADGASHARQVVSTAKADAERSGAVVGQAVAAMTAIAKSSQQVSQIIGVIDEIAFQTNLLALNAGVEAARAGEAGRGFAVVASEVRALAQRSAEAAKEIKALISASSGQVGEGVALVGETGTALARIAAQVSEINGIVSDIATSAHEQATGLDQVNTAVNQMDQVTQQNAAMVEQSTAASHGLAREAEELARLVGQFSTGEGGGVGRGTPKQAPLATPVPRRATALKATGRGGAARKPDPQTEQSWEEF